MIDLLISLTLALITFGISASLTKKDFLKVARVPQNLSMGLVLQLLFLPVLAFIIVSLVELPPEWKLGIFIVSICPGGATSNFISYLAKTDVALSISLTTINSFVILITIPLLVTFGLNYFGFEEEFHFSIFQTAKQMLLIGVIPVILGVAFNETFPNTSKVIQKPLKYINTLLLAIVFGIKFFAPSSNGGSGITDEIIWALLPICLIIHLVSMFSSFFISRLFRLSNIRATTIGIEVGLQNTTLALLITATLIGSDMMSQPALVFALFSFFTTLAFGLLMKKRKKRGNIAA